MGVTRRCALHVIGGLALWVCSKPGFAQTPATKSIRRETMDIKRNGSRPSTKAPEANFTGGVRVEPVFQVGDPVRFNGGSVYLRARRTHGVAHASARSDSHHHGRSRMGADRRRTDRGNSAGRRGVVSSGRETLARRNADYRHDAYRGAGISERQECGLAGEGQRRAISEMISRLLEV